MNSARRAISIIFFISGLGLSSWAPMVPYAKSRLGLNEADLGLILLAFGIGALLSMPLTGWLVQRFGSRNVTIYSALLLIVILPILTVAASTLSLSLFLFLFGATCGTLNVSMNSHAVFVEKRNDKPIMSGIHCLFSLGGLAGAGVMSLLLEMGMPLFTCSFTLSVLMAAVLIPQYKSLLPTDTEATSSAHVPFAFPRGKVIFLGSLCFISFLAEGSMLDWSAVFLRSIHGYEAALAGIGYAIFSVAMAFGRFIGDRFIHRFGPIMTIQVGSLLAASGLLLSVNFSWGYIELIGFGMIGLGAANIVPILFSAAGRLPDTAPSHALAVVTTLGYMGILLGPAFIGFVAQSTSLSTALIGVAVLLIGVGIASRRLELKPALQKA